MNVLDKDKRIERRLSFYNLRFIFILLPIAIVIILLLILSLM